jgi:hypothetical protein
MDPKEELICTKELSMRGTKTEKAKKIKTYSEA